LGQLINETLLLSLNKGIGTSNPSLLPAGSPSSPHFNLIESQLSTDKEKKQKESEKDENNKKEERNKERSSRREKT